MLYSQQLFSPSIRSAYGTDKKMANTDILLEKSPLTSNNAKRSFVQQFRMRVVDNNKRGRTVDKITADLAKPTYGNLQTTYASDFHSNPRPLPNAIDGKSNITDNMRNTLYSISPKDSLYLNQIQSQNQIFEK